MAFQFFKSATKITRPFTALFTVVLFFFALTLIAPFAYAAAGINGQINIQGKLQNKSDSTNVANGTYTVVFTLYDAASGGTNLWTETQSVTTVDGVFFVALGSVNPLTSVNFNSDSLYLGIKVGSDAEMTPRIQFGSVPYAFNAQKVNGLTVTNTSDAPFSSATTFKIGDGKTVVFNNGLTFSGTDSTAFTFPSTGGTVVTLDANQILTNKTIGSTGLVFSGASTDITTGTNEDLTISPNGTGNTIFGNGYVGIGITNPSTHLQLSDSGQTATGKALAIFDQYENQDIFTASASGAPKFTIARDGTFTAAGYTVAGGVLYTTSSGNVQQVTAGSLSSQCLVGGNGTTPAWGSCGGSSLFTDAGSFTYLNSTTDDLVLGASTTSAAAFWLQVTNGASPASTTLSLGTDGSKNAILKLFSTLGAGKASTISTDSSGNLNLAAPSGSSVVVGGGNGNIQMSLSNAADLFAADKTLTLASSYSSNDFTFKRALTGGANAQGGSVLSVTDISAGSGTINPDLILANAALTSGTFTGNLLRLQVSGSDKFLVDSSGNIGIGTTTPNAANIYVDSLAVSGTTAAKFYSSTLGLGQIERIRLGKADSNNNAFGIEYMQDATASSVSMHFYGDTFGNSLLLQKGGNVAIGTTAPAAKLQVVGNGTVPTASVSASTSFAGLVVDNTIGDLFTASSSGLTRFTITQNGNVGIGSTIPGSKLDVKATTADSWVTRLFGGSTQVTSVDTNGYVSFTPGISSTTGTIFNFGGSSSSTTNFMLLNAPTNNSGNLLNVQKNSTSKFLVDTNGNIGIGTTAPKGALDVRANTGTTSVASVSGATSFAGLVVDNSGVGDIFTASSSGLTRFVVQQGGAVVIGSNTNGLTFDPTNGGPSYTGTARPYKQIVLSPEYAGAALTQFYGAGTDTTNITGSMTSDASTSAGLRTHYSWTSATASPLQSYTVAVRVTLPQDFSQWCTTSVGCSNTNALQVDYDTLSPQATNNDLNVYIYNSSNTSTAVYTSTGNVVGSLDGWGTLSIQKSSLEGTQTWNTAGQTAIIYLRMQAMNSNHTLVGDIKLNYLAKF